MELGQKLGFLHVRHKARTRLAINYPGLAPAYQLCSHQFEIVGIGHFAHKLAPVLAIFLFLFFPLFTGAFGFILVLVDHLLDFLLFLGCVFFREWLVVLFNQAIDLLAVNLHDLVGLGLSGPHVSLAIEIVLNVPLDVGVVALALVVLDVLVGYHTKQLLHLFLRESTIDIGRQVKRGGDRFRCRRGIVFEGTGVGRIGWSGSPRLGTWGRRLGRILLAKNTYTSQQ